MAAVGAKEQPLGGPDYSFAFSFEESHDSFKAESMFRENAYLPYLIGVGLYLPILYFGQKFMANREPFKLRGPLMVWNSALAIFSIVGFARVLPEFLYTYKNFGFRATVCDNSWLHVKQSSYWFYLFVLSKTPELVDTFFLVLKKQRLIVLHVYHHSTVLIFAWFIMANSIAAARWFCLMNFGVHSVMYSYYALKTLPDLVRIPKWVSMVITTGQTVQMLVGTYVVVVAFWAHLTGQKCATTLNMSLAGLAIYVSYLTLFSHFFYKAYCSGARPARAAANKKRV